MNRVSSVSIPRWHLQNAATIGKFKTWLVVVVHLKRQMSIFKNLFGKKEEQPNQPFLHFMSGKVSMSLK